MLRAEFTVEPFISGHPGPHVEAALDAAAAAGLEVDMGPLGTSVEGDDDQVVNAMAAVLHKAMAAGATRVSLQVTRRPSS